jgi:hypothetical protein
MTIDGQLGEADWLVQSREQMNRSAALGVAVPEFPTASGPVDYALFVGGTLCGVVEAKPEGTTLLGFSDQAALERTRQGLDTWRPALFRAAGTGELTRDWREENRHTETVPDAAITIRDGWLDILRLYAIPSGWIWTTIGQAAEVLLGRQRAPQHHSGPHMRPYLRVGKCTRRSNRHFRRQVYELHTHGV